MTLQERILEVLGEKALPPAMLYGKLKGESAALVDAALSALMRNGAVTRELGHYQRGKAGKPPAPSSAAQNGSAPKERTVVVSIDSKRDVEPPSPIDQLSSREREIFELINSGLKSIEVAQRLGVSKGLVSFHLCNARKKLGIKVRCGAPGGARPSAPKPALAAAAPGAKPTTVGAAAIRKRPTFSPDLIARLVARQKAKAEEVQAHCDRLSLARQELADIEEMVRIATAKDVVT